MPRDPTSSTSPMNHDDGLATHATAVRELLLDAERQARALLLDVDHTAAAGLVRSWPAAVAAAAELWGHTGDEPTSGVAGQLLARVAEVAVSLEADLATARWPGNGTGDDRMRAIATNLTRAGELIEGNAGEAHLFSQQNSDAVRTRAAHTLYIATHAVGVALKRDGRERAFDRAFDPNRAKPRRTPGAGGRSRYEVGPGVRWADRLGAAERALGAHLRSSSPIRAQEGEQQVAAGLPRLREALAHFDIQAHRTLAATPTAGNLVLATRTEGMFLGAALTLTRAAGETGHLSQADLDPARLEHTLTHAGEAWSDLASRWSDLMPKGARVDPALAAAANQLREACRDLTHDTHNKLAPATVITHRADLTEALPVLGHYVDAATELAEATRPALRTPGLEGPARAINRRLTRDVESGRIPDIPNDLRAELVKLAGPENGQALVPEQVLTGLHVATSRAGRTSAAAANSIAAEGRSPAYREQPRALLRPEPAILAAGDLPARAQPGR